MLLSDTYYRKQNSEQRQIIAYTLSQWQWWTFCWTAYGEYFGVKWKIEKKKKKEPALFEKTTYTPSECDLQNYWGKPAKYELMKQAAN